MGLPPTLWQRFRQVIGRAVRETGQSLDRLGVKTASLAVTKHSYYDDPVIYEDKSLSRHRHQFPFLTSGRPVVHPQVAYLAPCATLTGSVFVGAHSSIWYGAVLRGDYCENAESFYTKYTLEVDDEAEEEENSTQQLLEQDTNTSSQISDTPTATNNTSSSSAAVSKNEKNKNTKINQNLVEPQPWTLSETRYNDRLDHHGGAIFIGSNTNIQDGCIVTAREQHTQIGNGVTVGHLAQLHSCTVQDYSLIGMGSVLNAGVVVETEALVAAGAVVPPHTTVRSGELWVGNPARKLRDLTTQERQKLHYQSSEYVHVAQNQRRVMQLGGNVIPDGQEHAGTSVHLVPSQYDQDEETTINTLDADEPKLQIREKDSSSIDSNVLLARESTEAHQGLANTAKNDMQRSRQDSEIAAATTTTTTTTEKQQKVVEVEEEEPLKVGSSR